MQYILKRHMSIQLRRIDSKIKIEIIISIKTKITPQFVRKKLQFEQILSHLIIHFHLNDYFPFNKEIKLYLTINLIWNLYEKLGICHYIL